MENPSTDSLKAAKHVMRYIKGILKFGLRYKKNRNFNLIKYSNSDYAGDHLDRRSTAGRAFFLGGNNIT